MKIANAPGYLDKLSAVYPLQTNPSRPLPAIIKPRLKTAFEKKDSKTLIKLLIANAKVFPVKESYLGFLKAKPQAIDENPKTLNRIAKRLYSLGFDAMVKGAENPIETNRQLGPMFKNWLGQIGYPVLSESQFLASTTGIKLLAGSDAVLAKFAKHELGCKLSKGIDLVAKANEIYVIGEAKFLTTPGGEQNGGFADAYSVVSQTSGNAQRIAIIDGFVWLQGAGGSTYRKIIDSNKDIMSALLLKDYLASL